MVKQMANINRIWDLGEEQVIKPSKNVFYKIMNALVLCDGKLYNSHSLEVDNFSWTDKSNSCSVVFRIGLPIGNEVKFQELSGFKLTSPDFVKGSEFNI